MRGDDAVEVGRVHHHDDVVARDAGVVDDDGERAELRLGALDHGVDLLLVGDVAHHDEALAAQHLDLGDDGRAGGFVGEIVDGDIGAGRGQAERDSAPYAAAGAGHQRYGSCQVELDAHTASQ